MKLAISTSGKDLEAPVTGFGRSSGFILYDTTKGDFNYFSNEQNMLSGRGAGAKTAQDLVQTGVQAVITAKAGPKAIEYLQGKGVKIFLANQPTVQAAIDAHNAGNLETL